MAYLINDSNLLTVLNKKKVFFLFLVNHSLIRKLVPKYECVYMCVVYVYVYAGS